MQTIMNNIFLPNDPLLYNQSNYQQLYEDRLLRDRELLDKQYKEYINKLNFQLPEDKLSLLNSSIRSMSSELKELLLNNSEFVLLNKELQDNVLAELVELVKNSINANPDMISNINKQILIITDIDNKSKEEERKNMSEINDYLKNYSNMTFNEYKKLKNNK